jgi:hypothetical protein
MSQVQWLVKRVLCVKDKIVNSPNTPGSYSTNQAITPAVLSPNDSKQHPEITAVIQGISPQQNTRTSPTASITYLQILSLTPFLIYTPTAILPSRIES